MTRWDLIASDEYIQVNLDSIIQSRRPVKETRTEAAQFVRCLVDELLEGDQGLAVAPLQNRASDKLHEPVDLGNTKALMDDLWLFLTNKPLYKQATIKREAFNHEMAAIIESVREYERAKANPAINIKRIQSALQSARDKQRKHAGNGLSEASIEARVCIEIFTFILEECIKPPVQSKTL